MAKKNKTSYVVGSYRVSRSRGLSEIVAALLCEAEDCVAERRAAEPDVDRRKCLEDMHGFQIRLVRNFVHQVPNLHEARDLLGEAVTSLLTFMYEDVWRRVEETLQERDFENPPPRPEAQVH